MSKLNLSVNNILIGVAVVGIIITGIVIYSGQNGGSSFPGLANLFGKSNEQVAKAAIDYINKNGLSQTPASLSGKVTEESGLVKFKIKIGSNEFDSYATKDGKFLLPEAINMTPKTDDKTNPAKTTAQNIQKTDKPVLEAYVVSSCPYGLQMQRAVAEAVKNVPALASSVVIRYIGSVENGTITAMHGPEEAQENLRQICLRDEQPNKFYDYLACYMKKTTATAAGGMPLGDSTGCQAKTGVDVAKLNACVSDPKRGLADAQKDFDLASKYNVSGSPTMMLGDTVVDESGFGGRSADGVRAIICAASKTEPSFCSTKLDTTEAAVSFSETYASASSSANNSANCQ
jgi:hypothetical protein